MSRRKPVRRRKRRRVIRRRTRLAPLLAILFIIAAVGALVFANNPQWLDPIRGLFSRPSMAALVPIDGQVAVHFIDVGQGDSVLIQTTAASVLIDGGDNPMGGRVVDFVRSLGIESITYVIATHPHADHIGGLIDVLGEFPVGALMMPDVAHGTLTFGNFLDAIERSNITLIAPAAGHVFTIPAGAGQYVSFTVIAPNSLSYANLNDYSISLRMTFGSTYFVFTGDAEEISEGEMVASGRNLTADVLHVGHHGSFTSTNQAFLDAVRPSIAVINVGEGNIHGHPHAVVLNRLAHADVRVYRTDLHGNITILSDGASLQVAHN